MYAVKKWRPYLLGRTFVIKTDHQSLKFLLEQKIGTPSQQKWISKLLGYDFIIEYKKGKENVATDALSRKLEVTQEGPICSAITILDPIWLEQLRSSYLQDVEVADICKKIQQGKLDGKGYEVKNGLLFKKGKLCLSKLSPFKQQVLDFIHSSAVGGHSGYQKSLH